MTPLDLAREFIKKGRADETLCERVVEERDIDDAIFGLHAQAAAEKYLKAILAIGQERPEHTHNLEALAAQCDEVGHPLPADLTDVFALTPFAVEFRYPKTEVPPLDRGRALELITGVREWAERIVG